MRRADNPEPKKLPNQTFNMNGTYLYPFWYKYGALPVNKFNPNVNTVNKPTANKIEPITVLSMDKKITQPMLMATPANTDNKKSFMCFIIITPLQGFFYDISMKISNEKFKVYINSIDKSDFL